MKRASSLNNRIDQWMAGRPWGTLIYCLPVLVAAVVTVVLLILLFSRPKSAFDQRYNFLVRQKLSTQKYEEARVACLRGLSAVKNQDESSRWLYYMALAVNGLGQQAQAGALINAAAPLDRPGCPEAQLMVAQYMLSQTNLTAEAIHAAELNPTNEVAVTLHQAERHLLNALASSPDSPDVNEALGRYYINTRQQAKAQAHLIKIYSVRPEVAGLLAVSADFQKDGVAALEWADRGIAAYQAKLIESAPNYSVDDRLGLVRCLYIKSKYTGTQSGSSGAAASHTPAAASAQVAPQDSPGLLLGIVRLLVANQKFGPALQTLQQHFMTSSNTDYNYMYSEICERWAKSIPSTQTNGPALRLKLIQDGLSKSPGNLALQFSLSDAANAHDDSSLPAGILMSNLMASATGITAAGWEFVLWTDNRIRGDMVAARQHLQSAYKLSPDYPLIINDMAMDLASGDRQSKEQGLNLIQSLLQRYPYDPGFRDTRGQILAQLGRNQEAVDDLQFAAARLPNPAETRKVLARVNAALGIVAAPSNHSNPLLKVRDLLNEHQYSVAIAALQKQSAADPDPAYSSAMAQVYLAWIEATPLTKHAQRLDLIRKGLSQDPDNQQLSALLLNAAHEKGPDGDAARQLLNQMIATAAGESIIQWNFLLGHDARLRGDQAAARQHLEKAAALAPARTEIQIELARIYALGDQADLERGLALMQPAVDKFPDNPDFRSIRGLILARLGRNQQAVEDLAFAAPRMQDPVETLQALAKVYDALGKPQLAEQQRRLARAGKLK